MQHPGVARTAIHRDHALIAPESHVPIAMPGWRNGEAIALISRELGAKFGQYLLRLGADALALPPNAACEHFCLVLAGGVAVRVAERTWHLGERGFAYLPPGAGWQLTATEPGEALLFEKPYAPGGGGPPPPLRGALDDVPRTPFLGDEAALLQELLPADPRHDWGINVFEFAPGGTLPLVETHFMEHGLHMLAGQGVYRLGERWYPVQAGDAIWMAPYLTQWYAATGKTPTRYIYYKEMHRAPAV